MGKTTYGAFDFLKLCLLRAGPTPQSCYGYCVCRQAAYAKRMSKGVAKKVIQHPCSVLWVLSGWPRIERCSQGLESLTATDPFCRRAGP
jgi:hypothetical protein